MLSLLMIFRFSPFSPRRSLAAASRHAITPPLSPLIRHCLFATISAMPLFFHFRLPFRFASSLLHATLLQAIIDAAAPHAQFFIDAIRFHTITFAAMPDYLHISARCRHDAAFAIFMPDASVPPALYAVIAAAFEAITLPLIGCRRRWPKR
jgi:hypothetical protein